MLQLAFILDPLETIKTYKDSSYAMMREAQTRGHAVHVLHQEDLQWRDGVVSASVRQLHITTDPNDWYTLGSPQSLPLARFSAVLMRKDPPFDLEYVYSTYLLERAQQQGARVYNDPRAIRDHNEKMAITEFLGFLAPTLVTRQEELIREFLEEHGDVILKPMDGMGGTSIFRVRKDDPNVSVIIETLTHYGRRTIMVQRYIPDIVKGDKRVLLIGGKPVPYALARIPKAGETRGNLAAGGTGVAQPLSDRDLVIAEALGPVLFERGLMLVGLDVIGDFLTEVNVTSPTCFQEITQQTGFNVAGMLIDAIERACMP